MKIITGLFLALLFLAPPATARGEESAAPEQKKPETGLQSREYIFKQQDLGFNALGETADGTYVLLGGAAGKSAAGANARFPVLSFVGKDGAVNGATGFAPGPAPKINENIGVRPLLGFGKPFALGGRYIAAAALDPETGASGQSPRVPEILLADFDGGFQGGKFYKFGDAADHMPVYLQPADSPATGKMAFLATRITAAGGEESFILTLNEKLESETVLPLPPACRGGLIYDRVNHRYITLPRRARGDKSICLIPEDGQGAKAYPLRKSFELDDGAVGADGSLVLAGKQELTPPLIGSMRNRPTQVLHFDRSLNFLSGLELTGVLDDLGNDLFAAPDGGYLLAAMIRENAFLMQTKTALIRLDDKMNVAWAALKDGSGPENVNSAIFRNDGSLSVLVKLGLYKQPPTKEVLGRRVMSFNVISSLDSAAILEFAKDGHEQGELTSSYKPRTDALTPEDGKIFDAGQPLALPKNTLTLIHEETPLVETKITLLPKTLGRPWDEGRE